MVSYLHDDDSQIRICSPSSPLGPSLPVHVLSHFSCARLFATPQTVVRQAPLSMGFSRQEYWSGLPCPPPGDRPNPRMEATSLRSPVLQADSLPLVPPRKPWPQSTAHKDTWDVSFPESIVTEL